LEQPFELMFTVNRAARRTKVLHKKTGKKYEYPLEDDSVITINPEGERHEDITAVNGYIRPTLFPLERVSFAAKDGFRRSYQPKCEQQGVEKVLAIFVPIKTKYGVIKYTIERLYNCVNEEDYRTYTGEEPPAGGVELEYLGPQYFIDCGQGVVLTGYYKRDQHGDVVVNAAGDGIDRDTGRVVSCP